MKIKSTELRIGNWLDNPVITVRHMQVYPMMIPQIATIEKEGGSSHMLPIPLDEEWLVKFGFIESPSYGGNNGYWTKKWYYDFLKKDIDFNLASDFDYTIEEGRFALMKRPSVMPTMYYVHELQNLYFSITGQELTIEQDGK